MKITVVLHFIVFAIFAFPAAGSAEPERVSVGVITALSGGMATIGTAVRNGIELARAERPELFQRIDFHYEDDQFDAKKSISAYQKLKSVDKISVLLGFGVVLGHSLAPLVERDHIPLFNFTFEAAPAVGRTYVIRAMNYTGQYQSVFAASMKERHLARFSIVRTEIPFFTAMANDFRVAMGNAAAVREVGVFNPDDTDFRTVILKLRSSTEPIGLFLLPEQLVQFARQAKEAGLQAPYFGTDLFESAARMTAEPELFEHAMYPDNEVSESFRSHYRAAYGNEAQLTFAGSSYDMTILIGELLGRTTPFRAEALLESVREVRDHPGALGNYHYRNEPDVGAFFEYPIRVKEIVNGRGSPSENPCHPD